MSLDDKILANEMTIEMILKAIATALPHVADDIEKALSVEIDIARYTRPNVSICLSVYKNALG